MPFYSFIHQALRSKEVLFGHDIYGNKTENVIFVRHHDNIYYMECKLEPVTIIKTDECYANQIQQAIDGNGDKVFIDQNRFLVEHATVIDCKKGSVLEVLLEKVREQNVINQDINGLSFALYKNNKYLDIADMLNDDAANHLVWLEEKSLNNDSTKNGSLWTSLMVLFRQHSVKIQVANMIFKYSLELCLVVIGLFLGLPPIKALSLASISIKKCIDFRSYISQNKLYKKKEIMKFHRDQLGRPIEVDLSQLTAQHFQAIYGALLDLTDRCAILEDVVNNLAPENERSTTPTPSQTSASRRSSSGGSIPSSPSSQQRKKISQKKRVRPSTSGVTPGGSTPSSPSPSSLHHVKIPQKKRVRLSKSGVAFCTK